MSTPKREAIIEAARGLFATKGYDATSVRDLVATASTTISNFYHHFDGKEHLLRTMLPAHVGNLVVAFVRGLRSQADPVERMLQAVRAGFFAAANDEFLCSMVRQVPLGANAEYPQELFERMRQVLAGLGSGLMTDAETHRIFRAPDPEATVHVLLMLTVGYCSQTPALREKMAPDRFFAAVDHLLRSAIAYGSHQRQAG